MRPRLPLAYAGLLIIALVAVVGFAAFSPNTGEPESVEPTVTETTSIDTSARVASAVLALRVSDAESRTATTAVAEQSTLGSDEPADEATEQDTSISEDETNTTAAPDTTTSSPPTTQATVAATEADTTPPSIRVTSPDDGDTVSDRVVTFTGTTEPGATVSSGPYAASVDDDGKWTLDLVLSPGDNGAAFTATDKSGNSETVRIVVTYAPPTTTTTAPPSTTTTTTAGSSQPKWSPLWPADAGGRRNVEAWRSLVAKYWPSDLVDCALNIIAKESEGDPRAYNSRTSAEGLFQHLSKYWKARAAASGFRDSNGLYATPYNAEANIAAAWHIAKNSNPWHRPWTVNPFYGACQG